MFELFLSFAQSSSISPNLDYVSQRMDTILESMLSSGPYMALIDIFKMLGVFMLLTYFMIDLIDRVGDTQFSLEILFRQLVKFVGLYAIMIYLPNLLGGFLEFTKAINELIINNVTGTSTYWEEFAQAANTINGSTDMDMNDGGGLLQMISLVGTQLIMQILTWTMSVDRALRIGFKSLIAPIACADMVTNGMSSNGIRYIKSILALYLQSPVMLMIMVCINDVCMNLNSDLADANLWTVIVGLFILWNTTKKTKEIADEII